MRKMIPHNLRQTILDQWHRIRSVRIISELYRDDIARAGFTDPETSVRSVIRYARKLRDQRAFARSNHGVWNDDLVLRLRELIEKKYGARRIAVELFGSESRKSAVIGKAYRLGLSIGCGPERRERGPSPQKRVRQPRAGAVKTDPLPSVEPPSNRDLTDEFSCTLQELGRASCRYGYGDPRTPEFRFCGAPIANPKVSYCAFHLRLCYVSRDKRKKRNTKHEKAGRAALLPAVGEILQQA